MKKRKEVSLRNHPGIYKEFRFNPKNRKWIPTENFRAMRRVKKDGRSHKEQAFFMNLEDTKQFRAGIFPTETT